MSVRLCQLIRLFVFSAGLCGAGGAWADAVTVNRSMQSSTIMEAFIEGEILRVELDVGLEDIPAFADLLPDELNEKLGNPPESQALRIQRFFEEGLVFQADGQRLSGRMMSIGPRPRVKRDLVTGEVLSSDGGEEEVIHVSLEYLLEGQPSTLMVDRIPSGSGERSIAIGFVVYHDGVAVNDFRYLVPGSVVELDWEDPWYSRFQVRTMRRTYESPLNVFVYAEPYEVRVEVVVRPLDLQPFVDLGLGESRVIEAEDYGEIQQKVASFLSENFVLNVDGEEVNPVLDRVHFLRRTLKSSTVIDPPEPLSAVSAQLGVIYVVPRLALPQKVALEWKFFPEKLEAIPVAASDEAGSLPGSIDRESPVLVWTNYLKNPADVSPRVIEAPAAGSGRWLRPAGWVGMIVGGGLLIMSLFKSGAASRRAVVAVAGVLLVGLSAWAGSSGRQSAVGEDQAREIVEGLLYNVYRSFDFRQEEEVYDMLAKSVAGPLLERTYLETRRGLVLQNQGGARAKVNELELAALVPEPVAGGRGFATEADWVVGGSVGHWGHIHQRRNRYRADLKVEPVDGEWKITGMEVTSEERSE